MRHVMILFVLFDGFFPLSTTSSVASTPDYLEYRFPGPRHVSQAYSLYSRRLRALFWLFLAILWLQRITIDSSHMQHRQQAKYPKLVNGCPLPSPWMILAVYLVFSNTVVVIYYGYVGCGKSCGYSTPVNLSIRTPLPFCRDR
ncbi:hypothetical protein C8R45DRAFT_366259 [Mycena sanguinolenta]|nr:hypothetical protein C8R45DRAFT_366259 [Mycena sanguinolenta]